MARVQWKSIRCAANAIIQDATEAEAATTEGRRYKARFHRWRAARRSMDVEMAARQHRGLDIGAQLSRRDQIRLEDFTT